MGVSSDGKVFIARRTVRPGWTVDLDVYGNDEGLPIGTLSMPSLTRDILTDDNGMVYVSHAERTEADPRVPAGLTVIRSGDLQTVAKIEFQQYYFYQLALGPDGLLYGAVGRRLAAGDIESGGNAKMENTGLLVAMDLDRQRVVDELPVPTGPYALMITPEGKAYILHRHPTQGSEPSQVSVYDLKERKLLK